jgi:cytochrome c biogenesis protein CcmG, thiol:disulfide interchange protein DsbE
MQGSARQNPTLSLPEARPKRRLPRALFILPAAAIFALLAAFAVGLNYNPSLVPSPLIGKKVPDFALPPIKGEKLGLSSRDLLGRVSLVNVFASWCVTCREEHPLLMALKEHGIVPIEGIDYEDKPADATAWLARMGNPYERIGDDASGRVGIDWGVYGIPETFLITRDGRIGYKVIGAITPDVLERILLPKIAELRKKEAVAARKKTVE